MDAPVDFTLDRARLLGSNLTSSSLGTYEAAYVDSGHASALSRSSGLTGSHASIQDLARVGTPSSMNTLGQYQSRFLHPSIAIQSAGASYAMMGNFLNGGSSSGEHLKSLMPAELQQYWTAHGEGCGTRYIINNNNIYSPYLSYLPATESLSLFAHNVGAGTAVQGQGQSAYHRIYDLHKEALFNVAPLGTSPSSFYGTIPPSRISPPSGRNASELITQSEKGLNKKDIGSRYVDSKKSIDLSKSASKIHDDISKPLTKNYEDVTKSSTKIHEDVIKSSTKNPEDFSKSSTKIHDDNIKSSLKLHDEITRSSIKTNEEVSKSLSKSHGDISKLSTKNHADDLKKYAKAYDDLYKTSSKIHESPSNNTDTHVKKLKKHIKDKENDKKDEHSESQSRIKHSVQDAVSKFEEQNKKHDKQEQSANKKDLKDEEVEKNDTNSNLEQKEESAMKNVNGAASSRGKTSKTDKDSEDTREVNSKSEKSSSKADKSNDNISKSLKEREVECSESETKIQHIPTLTTVTLTPSESMTSIQSSKNLSSSAFKNSPTNEGSNSPPGSLTGITSRMGIAQTSTTFSLPYYHSIYSHSQPPGAMDGKKVHAPTFTPEIGTLPSVASISSLPIQTTACDMRIKKETTSYSCCKERTGTSITSNNSHSPKYSHYSAKVTSPKSDHSDRKSFDNVKKGGISEQKIKRSHLKGSELNEKRSAKLFESKDKALDCSKTSAMSVDTKCKDNSVRNNGLDSVVKMSCVSPKEKSKLCSSSVKSPPLDTNSLSAFTVVNKSSSLGDLTNSRKRTSDSLSTKDKLNSSAVDKTLSHEVSAADKITESVKNNTKESNDPISLLKNGGPLLAICQDTKLSNRKSDSRTSKHRSIQIDSNGCRKSKLPTLAPSKISDGRDKIGNHEEHGSTGGMNIPIGIAVAQKREELKKESTDIDDSVSGDTTNNSQVSESQQNGTTEGHQNGFGSAVVSKPSSPPDTLSEMRNQLPANLIVTGSATGTGVAWSEDPSARHFANPWVQAGAINPSAWMGQMSYTLPTNIPTSTTIDTNQLPVSIPHGYKLVQDSVTGQFMVIPSNIDLFDPSRMWSGFPSAATHPGAIQQILAAHHTQMQHHVLAQAPDRQPSAEFAIAVQHYQQQLQQMYQARQDAVIACQDLSQGGVNGTGGVNSQTNSTQSTGSLDHKEVLSLQPNDVSGQQNDKEKPVNSQQNIPDLTQESCTPLPEIVSIKTEMSSVQSRGTSPMVPASEIEDTSQETIEASSINSGSDTEHSNKHSNIASVQTCASERCSSNESAPVDETSCLVEKDKLNNSCSEKIDNLKHSENPDTKSENKDKEQNPKNDIANSDACEISLNSEARAASESAHILAGLSCTNVVVSSNVSSCDQKTKSFDNSSEKTYNPFLDPQILQAADGLELLSALAEKRAKCEDVTDFTTSDNSTSWVKNNNSKNKESVCMFSDDEPPKTKRKQSISRTRSVPAVKPETKLETPSYYTSTGLRIPQGEEEINAIELDMRIRLAELQRQYKEKQREFARLTPKRDKEKEEYNSKRGPGRPRKRNHSASSPKSETPVVKQGQVKPKEPPIKKKKQAEELVDRVFRKTGGGFGMPLSKKLKANAMAALYKTQSGFTMKRKGSTSSSSSLSPLSTPVKFSPIIKKEKLNIKTAINSDGKGKLKVLKKLTDKLTKKVSKESSEPEHQDKDDSNQGKLTKVSKKPKDKCNEESISALSQDSKKVKEKDEKPVDSDGLGMLAKYAVDVLDENSTPVKKTIKRKVDEGVCNENTQTSSNENTVTTCTTTTTTTTTTIPTNNKPKDSDAEGSSDSTSPSNKKRKPGRPRKCIPNKTHGVTETIVAKNSKNFRLYQLQKFEDMWNAGVSQPKPKLEEKTPMKPLFLDEEWMLRRSERIFLSDPSPQSSPNFSYKETLKPSPSLPSPQKQASATKAKSEKAKLQKAKNIHDLTQRVKKKYSKALKVKQQSKEKKEKKQVPNIPKKKPKKPISKEIISDSDSSSDGDNIPLSALRERPQTPVPRSCVISQDELKDGLRVLLFKDGLFYEGAVLGIRPPDVYGVIIDNARGNRPLIYSQEEILKDAIIDVKASSARFLPEGTRVCAYWSQQFSCLYPGTVSKASPNPHADKNFINVEFDDGDSGRIPLDHIRMIPEDFPIVSYDPNPLLLIGKRRRHTTSDSVQSIQSLQSLTPEFHRSESLQPSDSKTRIKRGPGRPPKQKSENGLQNTESMNIDDDEDIDVCGLEEDHDEVFTSSVRSNKTGNDDGKSSKHSKDDSKKKQSNTSERKSGSEVKNKDKKAKNSQDSGKSSKKKEQRGKHNHSVGDTSDIFTFKRLPSLSDKLLSSLSKRKLLKTNKTDIEDNEGSLVISTNEFSSAGNSSDDDDDDDDESAYDEGGQELSSAPKKQKSRSLSTDNKSKIAAFLPARQLWRWSGKSTKRPGLKGKAKKEFYKSIIRGKEIIALGDCAVFLSTGRPHLPFIGRIISLWEAWGGQMVVKVKWFYHPEETRGGKKLQDMKGALFQSPHIDENDVQTISHKCDVLSFTEYKKRHLEERRRGEHKTVDDSDIYYLAGTYEPTIGLLKFQDDIM